MSRILRIKTQRGLSRMKLAELADLHRNYISGVDRLHHEAVQRLASGRLPSLGQTSLSTAELGPFLDSAANSPQV